MKAILLLTTTVPAQVGNVWPNPSAETALAGADGVGQDAGLLSLTQQTADAWRGKSCFEYRFTAGASGAAALVFGSGEPAVPVSAEQTVFLRVAGKVAAGASGTALELRARWLEAGGRLVSETPALCFVTPSTRRPWVVLDGWDTAPPGAVRGALALYAVNAAGETVLRADGVQVALDPARFVGGEDADEPAGAINRMPNPSFERGMHGWRSGSGAGGTVHSLEPDRTWAAAGAASLHLAGTVSAERSSYVSLVSQPVPVVGGEEYTLRATVNAAKLPEGGKVGLMLGWLDSTGAFLFADSLADQAILAQTGVHALEVTKPAPRDAASAVAAVGTSGGAAGDYDYRADAFQLLADSGAAPSRPFWVGFNDQLLNRGPITLAQDLDYDTRLGVNCVRLPINLFLNDLYRQVWPAPDAAINLDPVAPTLDAFFNAGVRVLLLSPITPWMLKDGRIDPARYGELAKLTAAFVRRWPLIVAVEAHNEPNTAHFWPPGADPVLFVRFLEAVKREVQQADPSMPVLAPTCNAALTKGRNLSIPDYMQAFYQAGGGKWCDALSIHPYPIGASSGSGTNRTLDFWTGADECMRQLRAVREAFQDSAKPVWITELGSPTTDPPYRPLLKTVTEEQQARSTVLLYDWARRQGDVRSIIYHTNAERAENREGDFGLVAADGRLKPSFAALQAELHRTPPPYFDGDTPGCRWLGPPGASASLRP